MSLVVVEKPSLRGVLQSSRVLGVLPPEELARLAEASRVVLATRGEVIWNSGATVDFIGLAGTGFVKMVRSCASGSNVTVELMGPGQVFGLVGAVVGTGCPLSAVAVTDLWYARISKSVFLDIYASSAVLKDQLVRRMAVRFHDAVQLMARLSNGRVEERIAAILFVLAESYGEREGDTLRITVPLTRQEISEMAGTTVESTIRTMSHWQKQGLIETDQHHLTIRQESRLEAIFTGI